MIKIKNVDTHARTSMCLLVIIMEILINNNYIYNIILRNINNIKIILNKLT